MEDLLLAPWQNELIDDPVDFYDKTHGSQQKQTNSLVLQDKSIDNQFSNKFPNLVHKKTLNLPNQQRKSQHSNQIICNFKKPKKSLPSKVDFYLFSCPSKEQYSYLQPHHQFNRKFYSLSQQKKPKKSFKLLQKIQNPNFQSVKFVKQKSFAIRHTYSHSCLQSKFASKHIETENQLPQLRKSLGQYDQIKDKFVSYKMKDYEKKKLVKKMFSKKTLSKNDNFWKNIDHSFEMNYLQRLPFKSINRPHEQRIALENQQDSKFQIRQNKNVLKDNGKDWNSLKKNKKLSELEKYNLFGYKKNN